MSMVLRVNQAKELVASCLKCTWSGP